MRDFFDPGALLQYYASAAALLWSGHNLFGEALLTAGFIAAGAGLTFFAAARLSGSFWIERHGRLHRRPVDAPPLQLPEGLLLRARHRRRLVVHTQPRDGETGRRSPSSPSSPFCSATTMVSTSASPSWPCS